VKITPHKIALVKSILPQEDRDLIDSELAAGELSPRVRGLIEQALNWLSPKKNKAAKGAFGSGGLNRKKKNRDKKKARLLALLDDLKEDESKEEN
jgi:hypothetical protein